jgi:hypothetical protein
LEPRHNATLAEYAAFRRLNRVKGDPADAVRRCAKAWNRAIHAVPGWPAVELSAPASTLRYTQPLEVYPAELRADIDGRWRTLPVQGEMILSPKLLCDDWLATDGIRASGCQHPVQHSHADGSFGLLASKAAGSQPRSDQRLVTTHCRFY